MGDMALANGHNRSHKRGRSADSDPEGANFGNKRSRLGMPASVQQPEAAQQYLTHEFVEDQHAPGWADAEGTNGMQADARFHGIQEMVHQVHSNQISLHACEAKNQLRTLDAAEGIGVMAWLIDGMLSQRTDPDSHALIADWVTDLADFARHRIQLSGR